MKRKIFLAVPIMALMLFFFTIEALADKNRDIDQHRDCIQCGMDRKAYGYSRMLVEFKDGTRVGTCSLHCVVTELANHKSSEVISYKVADRDTQTLIDAEKAVWVIGGKKRGVMTMRAKWAFTTRESAQKFIDAYGGKAAAWQEILAAAREDAAPKPR